MKNSPGFIFPHTYPPKTHPISYFPIRIRPKRTQFYTQTVVAGHFGAYAIRPYTGTCKFRPVLDPNLRRRTFQGVCFCALHGYMKNPAGFIPKPLARNISGRMQYAPTRVRAKPARFHIPAHGYTKNAPDFTLSNKDTPKRTRFHPSQLRTRPKPARFYTQTVGEGHFGAYAIRPYTGTCIIRPVSYSPTRIRQKRTRFYLSQ